MAIDPQKMAAFASAGPKSAGPKPGSDVLDAIESSESEMETVPEDMLEGGPGRFGKLIPLLEAHAAELEEMCDDLDPMALMDVNTDLSDDERQILAEDVVDLPEELLGEMMDSLDGLTAEEAEKLAAHLENESIVEDGDRIAALLVHVSKLIDSGELSMEEAEEGEEALESPEHEASETPEEEYAEHAEDEGY